MPTITEYYGIKSPVPFIDVEISRDNRLFVDPRAIRLQRKPQPFAKVADTALTSFFDEIVRCVMSSNPVDRRRGLDLLQHFGEPRETRLGMATNGINGHGGADDVGEWIWRAMTGDVEVLIRVGLLREIEALPMFVEGIGKDITSDLTTRIIYEALAKFTAEVMAGFPEFVSYRHPVDERERQIWDVSHREWNTATIVLPIADGKPLLLIPNNWAHGTLLMTAGRYYQTSVLGYAQGEQAIDGPSGRLIAPTKESLKKQASLPRGRNTNLNVTVRAHETSGEDLIGRFKGFVDGKYLTQAA